MAGEKVAVGAPIRVDVRTTIVQVGVKAEQQDVVSLRQASHENDLDRLATERTGRQGAATCAQGSEDAEDVVSAPGPKSVASEQDLMPIGHDAQAGRADYVTIRV